MSLDWNLETHRSYSHNWGWSTWTERLRKGKIARSVEVIVLGRSLLVSWEFKPPK